MQQLQVKQASVHQRNKTDVAKLQEQAKSVSRTLKESQTECHKLGQDMSRKEEERKRLQRDLDALKDKSQDQAMR